MLWRSLTLSIALLSVSAWAENWRVQEDRSSVSFVSVKNGTIAENHSFAGVTGSVSKGGQVEIRIDLAGVDSRIPIRDKRMRELLFEVGQFPYATVTANLPLAELGDYWAGSDGRGDGPGELPSDLHITPGSFPGEPERITVTARIEVHGMALVRDLPVRISCIDANTYQVSSHGPIAVHVSDFGLSGGIEALRAIAGLQSIEPLVPVTFNLTLFNEDARRSQPARSLPCARRAPAPSASTLREPPPPPEPGPRWWLPR